MTPERRLLGMMLVDNSIIAEVRSRTIPTDWSAGPPGDIWGAIRYLRDHGYSADIVTVQEILRRKRLLLLVGGMEALAALVADLDGVPPVPVAEVIAAVARGDGAKEEAL